MTEGTTQHSFTYKDGLSSQCPVLCSMTKYAFLNGMLPLLPSSLLQLQGTRPAYEYGMSLSSVSVSGSCERRYSLLNESCPSPDCLA